MAQNYPYTADSNFTGLHNTQYAPPSVSTTMSSVPNASSVPSNSWTNADAVNNNVSPYANHYQQQQYSSAAVPQYSVAAAPVAPTQVAGNYANNSVSAPTASGIDGYFPNTLPSAATTAATTTNVATLPGSYSSYAAMSPASSMQPQQQQMPMYQSPSSASLYNTGNMYNAHQSNTSPTYAAGLTLPTKFDTAASSLTTNAAAFPPQLPAQQQQQQQPNYQHPQPQQQQQQLYQSPPPQPLQPPLPPQQQYPQYSSPPPPQPTQQQNAAATMPYGYNPQQQQQQQQMPPTNSMYQQQQSNNMYGGPPTGQQQTGMQEQGARPINLLAVRNVLPSLGLEPPLPQLKNNYKQVYCDPDVFRCTLTAIPRTSALLDKTRLPFGILIHPFRDLSNLQVLTVKQIVRCRSCRTYINPWITFIDITRWRCNICGKQNEVPQDLLYDPASRQMTSPETRPEICNATVEYIASQEYAIRPPQPAIYLFLIDVSYYAIDSGYLTTFCRVMKQELGRMPGDARRCISIIAYDSSLHFFSLAAAAETGGKSGATPGERWQEIVVGDLEEVFVPDPSGLLINVEECHQELYKLLDFLPQLFADTRDTGVCTGAALQIAYKMLQNIGGRVTLFVGAMPNVGPGALKAREDNNMRAANEVKNLAPETDFYKSLSLECANQHIGVDLFVVSGVYCDISTLSNICNTSAGAVHYYPAHSLKTSPSPVAFQFAKDFERYLTRKIGFEAVLRIRCTMGISMRDFGGNFFVRSTDLVVLPVVNPDAGYAFKMEHDEALSEVNTVCFQAALLYTTAYGERRIRVHTLNIPTARDQNETFAGADQEAIAAFVARLGGKFALEERSMDDVRQGTLMCAEDALKAYTSIVQPVSRQLLAPMSLRCLPLFTQAAVKSFAFRAGISTPLDWRAFAIQSMRQSPVQEVMRWIYPPMFRVDQVLIEILLNDNQNNNSSAADAEPKSNSSRSASRERGRGEKQQQQNGGDAGTDGSAAGESENDEVESEPEEDLPAFPQLHLSSEFLHQDGIYLLDAVMHCILYVRRNVPPILVQKLFGGLQNYAAIPQYPNNLVGLPPYEQLQQQQGENPSPTKLNAVADAFNRFFHALRYDRRIGPALEVVVEDDRNRREVFLQYMYDDRQAQAPSYVEVLKAMSARQTSK